MIKFTLFMYFDAKLEKNKSIDIAVFFLLIVTFVKGKLFRIMNITPLL